jgi:pyroglutamyl-peptidase
VRAFDFERWTGRRLPAVIWSGPRLRLLLTGFGPFPGIAVNASAALVDELARRLEPFRAEIALRAEVLPTEWLAGPLALERLLAETRPHIALHFGVASQVAGFRLETRAENEAQLHADALGLMPVFERLSLRGPAQLRTTLPVDAIRARLLGMGLPVETSEDAGKYLCNSALYRSIALARRERPVRLAGFVHIPAEYPAFEASSLQSLDWAGAVEGASAIVEVCLASARERVAA